MIMDVFKPDCHFDKAWIQEFQGIGVSSKGVAGVFHDLERSAVAVLKAAGKETTVTVEHKYGVEAGQLTDDSLATAGHVADITGTYWSWKTWGIKFLGKIGEVMKDEKKDTDPLAHR
eukprot:Em0004g1709a